METMTLIDKESTQRNFWSLVSTVLESLSLLKEVRCETLPKILLKLGFLIASQGSWRATRCSIAIQHSHQVSSKGEFVAIVPACKLSEEELAKGVAERGEG